MLKQTCHVSDAQIGDVHVKQDPLRSVRVSVPVRHYTHFGVAYLQGHEESRAVFGECEISTAPRTGLKEQTEQPLVGSE